MNNFRKFSNIIKSSSPGLKNRLLGIFIILAFFNGAIWLYALISWHTYPLLLGYVALAYGLGLRHAVDADHIAAIDNTTRKLIQDGKRPVGVGFFFSLGHSTIVVFLSILVAFSASYIKNNLPIIRSDGAIIGTAISGLFLLLIGVINLIVLIDIFKTWKEITNTKKETSKLLLEDRINNLGFFTRILKPILNSISNSWQMYFIGLLFGLSFDTASEVGLLSISAIVGVSGMPTANIIILPLAFTAAMSLIDTLDGVLMLGAYGWAYIKPIRKLYYNMNITFISVIIALGIGSIEAMQVIFSQLRLSGGISAFIMNINFGNLGYLIIAVFILCWIFSLIFYKAKKYDFLDIT